MDERIPLALREEVAAHLEARAEDITDQWLEELESRLGVHPSRLLPTPDLRDHMPDLVRGLGQVLRVPDADPPVESVDYLRLFAELRREQGYDVQEILREFDVLEEIVFDHVGEWLEQQDVGAREIISIFNVLRGGLGRIGVITVDMYQESHLREKREVSERLAEFARTLEHEIRGPLQTAASSAEVLGRDEMSGQDQLRRNYAQVIQGRLQRISELIDDVHELSVAEDALTEVRWQPLRDVIQAVFEETDELAERHGVEVHLEEPLPEVHVDSARVKVALMNLVSNGIKYSDPEKDERWVRVAAGEVERDVGEPVWRIEVEDNGLGVPPGVRDQIFQRSIRGHADVIQGTGMGLAIVKEVMEQRGGTVAFESDEGEGSTFVLQIPPRLGSADRKPDEVQR